MKPHCLSCAALALALTVPVAFSQEAKKDDPNTVHTEIRLGPLTLGVSADVTTSETHKSPYLGVVLRSLSPELCAQLNLPEGMGLDVDAVSKDSPAEKAGIKRFDVLKKFNDQLLCSDEQLDILVKAAGAGAKATLGIFRGGKEQNVDIVIGERADADPGKTSLIINSPSGGRAFSGEFQFENTPPSEGVQDKLKKAQEKMDGIREKQADAQKQVAEAVRRAEEAGRKALEAAREHGILSGSGSGVQMYSFYPEEHHSSHNSVIMTDGDGTVEISETNGKTTLKIKDAAGTEILVRSPHTEADNAAIPEKYRAKVKEAEERIKAATEAAKKHAPAVPPPTNKLQPQKMTPISPTVPKPGGPV